MLKESVDVFDGCFIQSRSVFVRFLCTRLNRIISVQNDAVMCGSHGWLCGCVDSEKRPVWTFGSDESHKPLEKGVRLVFDDVLYQASSSDLLEKIMVPEIKVEFSDFCCDSCREWRPRRAGRWIFDTGEWVCYACYPASSGY